MLSTFVGSNDFLIVLSLLIIEILCIILNNYVLKHFTVSKLLAGITTVKSKNLWDNAVKIKILQGFKHFHLSLNMAP